MTITIHKMVVKDASSSQQIWTGNGWGKKNASKKEKHYSRASPSRCCRTRHISLLRPSHRGTLPLLFWSIMKASSSLASKTSVWWCGSSEIPSTSITDHAGESCHVFDVSFAFSVWKWVDNQAGPGSRGWPRGRTVQDFAGETVSFMVNMDALCLQHSWLFLWCKETLICCSSE